MPSPFDGLVWTEQELRVGAITFDLQELGAPRQGPRSGHFVLYKDRATLDRYATIWPERWKPRRVFEIGLWTGGSAVLWMELLMPEALVGIDIVRAEAISREYLDPLESYVAKNSYRGRLTLVWGTNQADGPRLRHLVGQHCEGKLDLVLDDASHQYGPTRASFEALFPLLVPGGWYFIEDWAWALAPPFPGQAQMLALSRPPSELIGEIVQFAGRAREAIRAIRISGSLAAIQRGSAPLPAAFSLAPAPQRARSRFLWRWLGR